MRRIRLGPNIMLTEKTISSNFAGEMHIRRINDIISVQLTQNNSSEYILNIYFHNDKIFVTSRHLRQIRRFYNRMFIWLNRYQTNPTPYYDTGIPQNTPANHQIDK